MSFQWENIMSLWWLALVVAIAMLVNLARHDQMERWQKVAQAGLLHTWRPYVSLVFPPSLLLLMGVILLLVFALANPQGGTRETQAYSRNQNVVLTLDLSQSMMAGDLAPNRLERARIFAYDLLDNLQGQRVALVVFAGNAYLQLPLTTDYAAAALFLRNLTTDMMPEQGTNITAALDRSLNAILSGGHAGSSSAVVLISDGEDHDKGAIGASRKLAQRGVVIHTVGVGTPSGAPVPEPGSGELKRDAAGEIIISKLHEPFLQELAQVGKGAYFSAGGGRREARSLAAALNKEEAGQAEKEQFFIQREWYQWLLVPALLFLVYSFFIRDKVRKIRGSAV